MGLVLLVVFTACGGEASPVDAAKPAPSGFVSIWTYDEAKVSMEDLPGGGGGSAAFFPAESYFTPQQQIGPCEVRVRDFVTSVVIASAGKITITGTSTPLELTPNADGGYNSAGTDGALFSEGDTVMFDVAGADAPAFTASLTMPGPSTITMPSAPPPNVYLTIDRANDFFVSWTGGGAAKFLVDISSTTSKLQLLCRFDASAGMGTIPAPALQQLPPGMGFFTMSALAMTEEVVNGWTIEVAASYWTIWPNLSNTAPYVVLQ